MVKIENQKGAITIDPEVFANLAGDAATSCFGVKAMAAQAKDGGVFQLRRESMSKVSKATGVPVKRVDVYVDTMLID